MNYQEMSDRHINCLVHDVFIREEQSSFGLILNVVRHPKDYCNSWADAGQIIQDNGINLMASTVVDSGGLKEWEAMSYEGNCHHWGELNPLRAAMIVFLMMKGGE
ncbi:phage protein NinX family protein [Rosenbergiella australiborealis]|uniref:phage protein NinX family protein n=1 Tax=Rosenbergiella australiborealis TaxID=1544696 RepID=UPI001F4DB0BE|nr:phage protein NinX family protein [Rosenbergiella australiborealis]